MLKVKKQKSSLYLDVILVFFAPKLLKKSVILFYTYIKKKNAKNYIQIMKLIIVLVDPVHVAQI